MASYDLTDPSVVVPWDNLQVGDILNIPYSGSAVSIDLPVGMWRFECWGAQCGKISSAQNLGFGGYITGMYTNDIVKKLYIYAGGQGKVAPSTTVAAGTIIEGGWNGGGKTTVVNAETGHQPGTGGGASDIRIGVDSLYARVIVAGGGGYTSQNSINTYCIAGGFAGTAKTTPVYNDFNTTRPTSGMSCGATLAAPGKGVVAKYDGSFGKGGDAWSYSSSNYYMGSGGGGWYGGGGSSNSSTGESGGSNSDTVGAGGSSYAWCKPLAQFAKNINGWMLGQDSYMYDVYTIMGGSTSSSAARTTYAKNPASIFVGDKLFYEPNGTTRTYGHEGNGYVRITKLNPFSIPGIYVKKNGKITFIKELDLTAVTTNTNEKDVLVDENGNKYKVIDLTDKLLTKEELEESQNCKEFDEMGQPLIEKKPIIRIIPYEDSLVEPPVESEALEKQVETEEEEVQKTDVVENVEKK